MVILVYILLCIIWGSTWMGIKLGLDDAPPFLLLTFRYVLSVIILFSIILIKRYKFPFNNLLDILKLAYPGLYIYGGSYILIYIGESYITSSLTSVLFASFPLFVALLSIPLLKAEKLNLTGWIGLLIGFLGVVIIFYDSLQFSGNIFWGCSLIVLSSFIAAYGMILHKRKYTGVNIYMATAIQMSMGMIPMIICSFFFENLSDFKITLKSVGSVVYLAVFGSVIAFSGYYWLMRHTTAVVVSMIAFITPLAALIIGVGLFNENLTLGTWLGSGVILTGVFIVIKR